MRYVVQLLALPHTASREHRILKIDYPVIETRRRYTRSEERAQNKVRRRQREKWTDAKCALAWAGRRKRSPTLPGSENRTLAPAMHIQHVCKAVYAYVLLTCHDTDPASHRCAARRQMDRVRATCRLEYLTNNGGSRDLPSAREILRRYEDRE